MKKQNKIPVTFKMDSDSHKKLIEITEKEPWITKSWIINTALREYINNNYK
jgi:predicted transcriptional regulator